MIPLAIFAAFFLTVFAGTLAVGYLFAGRASKQPEPEPTAAPTLLFEPSAAGDSLTPGSFLAGVGHRFGSPKSTLTRSNLEAAGFRSPSAVPIFNGIKFTAAVIFALFGGLFGFIMRDDFAVAVIVFAAGAGIGFLLPERFLEYRIVARRSRIREAVPPALDLMVMSVEAGQSINQAILDTSNELAEAYPDLASEFAQVNLELRAGKSRADALFRLGDRNREPELKKLVSLLIDADRFGSSLGPAMRTHARYLRTRMRQQAQESARKVAVRLVFPVFFLIFPSMLLVTLAPALIRMFEGLNRLAGK